MFLLRDGLMTVRVQRRWAATPIITSASQLDDLVFTARNVKYQKNNPLRVCELCAGYSSQGLAMKYLQDKHPDFAFDIVAWSEIEPNAIMAHNLLFPEYAKRNLGDMSKIDWTKAPDFDFLTYSTPCQSVSQAGLRKGITEGSGTRSSLLWWTRNAIIEKRPKYLMMENVKGLLTEKFRPQFFKWLRELESYGYSNFFQVLNSKDYDVPQNRERIFVISVKRTAYYPLDPTYAFPRPRPLTKCVEDVVEDDVDEQFYLSLEQVEKFIRIADMDKLIDEYEAQNKDSATCIAQ